MTIRHPFRILALGLFLGWAFDWLFWDKTPGVSLLIYAILLLAVLFQTLRWQKIAALRTNWWLPPLLLIFATLGFMRANSFLIFLNILAMLTILILISNHLARRSLLALHPLDFVHDPMQSFLLSIWHSQRLIRQANQPLKKEVGGKYARFLPGVIKGLLISIPIFLILVPLLVSADLIFAQWIRHIFSWDIVIEWSIRGVLMILMGVFVAGGAAYTALGSASFPSVLRKPEDAGRGDAGANDTADSSSSMRLGVIETLIPINLVNLLFLIFVVIQIPYLFGGELNIGEHSFTYAEYARRGFAELVFVAMFIFGLLLSLRSVSHLPGSRARRAFNVSATLLLLLTLILLASAFKRLALYESVYGFTTMRIYPHVFMIWLGLLLLWFAATLWLAPERLAIGILIAAFGFILTLNLLNPDAFIVRKNIERFQKQGQLSVYDESGRVDVDYVSHLSADSVPALVAALPHLQGSLHDVVAESLSARYRLMSHTEPGRPWQSWNFSRWRAYKLLQAAHFEVEK